MWRETVPVNVSKLCTIVPRDGLVKWAGVSPASIQDLVQLCSKSWTGYVSIRCSHLDGYFWILEITTFLGTDYLFSCGCTLFMSHFFFFFCVCWETVEFKLLTLCNKLEWSHDASSTYDDDDDQVVLPSQEPKSALTWSLWHKIIGWCRSVILSCVCLFELFGLGSGDDLVFAQCFLSDSQTLVVFILLRSCQAIIMLAVLILLTLLGALCGHGQAMSREEKHRLRWVETTIEL